MLLAAYFQMPAAYYDPCGYKNVSDFSVLIYIYVYQMWNIVPSINKDSVVGIYIDSTVEIVP